MGMAAETDPNKIAERTKKLGEIRRNPRPASREVAERQLEEHARLARLSKRPTRP